MGEGEGVVEEDGERVCYVMDCLKRDKKLAPGNWQLATASDNGREIQISMT